MNDYPAFPQTSNLLLSLAQDLQAFSELAKKLQKKLLLLTKIRTGAAEEEEIEYIDDPETIKSIGKSLADYKAGRYVTLKTKEDIHNFVASL